MLTKQSYANFATTDFATSITATEFEILVANYMAELGKKLADFKIKHNVYLRAHDGVYQIDVLASFRALGVNMTVLVECKRYANPVQRDVVQVLNDKLHSTGAHKGIIFSTSGFQEGAIQYALRHKIALITMLPGKVLNITNSLKRPMPPGDNPQFIGEYISAQGISYITANAMFALVSDLLSISY